MLGLYLLGIATAFLCALLFKRTLLKGPPPPFVLELPSYKVPSPRVLAQRLFERAQAFLVRAGSVILAMSLVIWALASFPRSAAVEQRRLDERATIEQRGGDGAAAALAAIEARAAADQLEHSALGRAGQVVAPAFRPLGWDWRITVATLASFPAREVVVATLGTIFSVGGEIDEESPDLRAALAQARRPDGGTLFTLPVALSVMVFFALCCQCGATIATIRRETNSWGWAGFTFGYMTVLAYAGGALTHWIATMWSP
jgi:ferrous iron transport protein B